MWCVQARSSVQVSETSGSDADHCCIYTDFTAIVDCVTDVYKSPLSQTDVCVGRAGTDKRQLVENIVKSETCLTQMHRIANSQNRCLWILLFMNIRRKLQAHYYKHMEGAWFCQSSYSICCLTVVEIQFTFPEWGSWTASAPKRSSINWGRLQKFSKSQPLHLSALGHTPPRLQTSANVTKYAVNSDLWTSSNYQMSVSDCCWHWQDTVLAAGCQRVISVCLSVCLSVYLNLRIYLPIYAVNSVPTYSIYIYVLSISLSVACTSNVYMLRAVIYSACNFISISVTKYRTLLHSADVRTR